MQMPAAAMLEIMFRVMEDTIMADVKNEGVVDNTEGTGVASMNAALAVDFTLFKSKMTAMFTKEKAGIRFLVIPINQGDAPIITLDELIADVKKMAGGDTDTHAIEDALKQTADDAKDKDKSIDTSKITFQLKMLYLYIDTTQGEGKKVVEYAFNVNIMTTGLIPAALSSIITVDHLGIAVWNTSRDIILNKMSIVDINTYLGIAQTDDSDKDKG